MGRLMIVNGSPRAPQSNSKQYAALFRSFWRGEAYEYNVTQHSHAEAFARLENAEHLLLVFPLYADGIPAVLMRTLKELAVWRGTARPRIHVLVNCGFLEPEQTRPAVEMVRFFCKRYGFPWGMALQIGSGEAILNTPFSFLVRRGLRRLAAGMRAGRSEVLSVRMPLNRRMFVWASGRYWTDYGAKNNITAGEMRTMEIEGG